MSVLAENRVGTSLGAYYLESVLGRGGMSIVYRADDLRLKRKVALKLLAPELGENDAFRDRFLRESQLAASLDHPNVVPVYEAGEFGQLLYIAMRYVPGTDLRALLRRDGALEPERSLTIVAQLADALDAAHNRELIHRDVKPSNVLVTGEAGHEHCYLADFGLSTSASDRSAVADPQQVIGTIDYVAPEQIRDEEIDGRADVYSLSCLLYECLSGDVPFRRSSDVAVIYAHLEDAVPSASERQPGLPAEIDDVLRMGMAKNPSERWPTCGALVEAARSGLGAVAVPAPVRRSRRPLRSRLAAVAIVGAGVVAAVLAAVLLTGGGTAIASDASLVRIDPAGGRAEGSLVFDTQPTAVTVCAGSVWVTRTGGKVSQVDPKTLTPHTVDVHGAATDVADDGNLAAIVSGPPPRVTMIDAAYGMISNVILLPGAGSPATATVQGPDIWVANPGPHTLDRLGPPYTSVADRVRLPGSPRLVAAGSDGVWAAGGRQLWRVDPGRDRVTARVTLPFAPHALAAGNGAVWLVDTQRDRVVRFDPRTRRFTAIHVGRRPVAVSIGHDAVWTANRADGTVSKIDGRRGRVVRTIDVGAEPIDLVAGLGGVWVVRRTD
jgi:tRNA A-37 threonylcarbamoyl transferase component Bud32/DNA-binding beta-propeller fold protein YncE